MEENNAANPYLLGVIILENELNDELRQNVTDEFAVASSDDEFERREDVCLRGTADFRSTEHEQQNEPVREVTDVLRHRAERNNKN